MNHFFKKSAVVVPRKDMKCMSVVVAYCHHELTDKVENKKIMVFYWKGIDLPTYIFYYIINE